MKKTSAISNFHKLSIKERVKILKDFYDLNEKETKTLTSLTTIGYKELVDMHENPVSIFPYILRFANYFKINGRDYFIPYVTEEASVVAGASSAAKLCYSSEGVRASVINSENYPKAVGQIQLIKVKNPEKVKRAILKKKEYLLKKANEGHRYSKVYNLKIDSFNTSLENMLIVNLFVDPGDAMGAAVSSKMAEKIAPELSSITGYPYNGMIISNYFGRLTKARLKVPVDKLTRRYKDEEWSGEEVRDRILWLDLWNQKDPSRAVTNNKGIMNGIDAVARATIQDTRAIEASAHSYACKDGKYKPLSRWYAEGDYLVGELEIPIPCGIVGGEIKKYPKGEFLLKRILKPKTADEFAEIMASVGLVQNLAALRMLATIGLTRGHKPHR